MIDSLKQSAVEGQAKLIATAITHYPMPAVLTKSKTAKLIATAISQLPILLHAILFSGFFLF